MIADETSVRAQSSSPRRYAPTRLLAPSDGVFAIAITHLVLPLTGLDLDPDRLAGQLRAASPQIVVFVVGFAVIGVYWLVASSTL